MQPALVCQSCGRGYGRGAAGLPRSAAGRGRSRSARNTSTKRCTSMPATSTFRRRCSARRSAMTCCGRFSRHGASDLVADLGCGSGRALRVESRLGSAGHRHRHHPVLREEARRDVDLLLADLRRLPFADGTFTKAYSLDVLEHLSPESLRGMLKEAARILAPGGRAVRLHARPEECADRRAASGGSTGSPVNWSAPG